MTTSEQQTAIAEGIDRFIKEAAPQYESTISPYVNQLAGYIVTYLEWAGFDIVKNDNRTK